MGDSRNGYELRTDLLGMAIGIVADRVGRKVENEHFKPEGNRQSMNLTRLKRSLLKQKNFTLLCRRSSIAA